MWDEAVLLYGESRRYRDIKVTLCPTCLSATAEKPGSEGTTSLTLTTLVTATFKFCMFVTKFLSPAILILQLLACPCGTLYQGTIHRTSENLPRCYALILFKAATEYGAVFSMALMVVGIYITRSAIIFSSSKYVSSEEIGS